MASSEEQSQGPVIRDRRRIDPVTGQPRESAQGSGAASAQASRGSGQPRPGKHAVSKPGSPRSEAAGAARQDSQDQAPPAAAGAGQADPGQAGGANGTAGKAADSELATKLAERTADLQRIQAEYANYRKRVERDRVAVRDQALASVVAELLPVLDDIGRAREHGELTGGFKAVAESLEAVAAKLGMTAFGEPGEAFDPNVHEALMHSYSPDVTEPTAVQILQPGYRVGERILRPARVAVAEPTDPSGARTGGDAERAKKDQDSSGAAAPDEEGTAGTGNGADDAS
jgi:molecular chaperone GrpE